MPKLSIITINYNNVVGLAKTIDSVLTQTSNDFEYIVIDGGSTDGSVNLIKKFEQKIAYWVSEPDKGIYHAMNKGIKQAKGEYCQFLNSGDYLVSNDVVSRMLSKQPIDSILIGNLLKLQPNGQFIRDKGAVNNISFMTFYQGTLNHSCAYIKRSLFVRYGMYDESLKIVSDWKFYLHVVGLNNETVEYRDIDVNYFDTSGISSKEIILNSEERREVLRECLPEKILKDYDRYCFDIDQINNLKKFYIIWKIVYLISRVLFKIDKWRSFFVG